MRRLPVMTFALGVLAATFAPVGVAHAAPAERTERVLLAVRPQDPAALKALAARRVSGKVPAAALAAALPSRQRLRDVAGAARGLGLTVREVSTMSVVVDAPATTVRSLFGSARSSRPMSTVGKALPHLPAALRGLVTVALGGDEDRPAFRHFNHAAGLALRNAYNQTSVGSHPAPVNGSVQTVATVQLSDWHPTDLTQYVADARADNPSLPAVSYVGVTDPDFPPALDDSGDDIEVSLDQEALYAVAPYARQRAYLVENSGGGFFTALARIGDDASDPFVDHHLVATSISWGLCEDLDLAVSNTGDAAFVDAMESVLAYVVASGVTVFAATGDAGAECRSYPATSPLVVAVGGTEHTDSALTSAATTWDDPASGPFPAVGSGGGTSSFFPRPAYQTALSPTITGRSVPDLSALGGNPGFSVYSSSPALGGPAQYLDGVLGTSLATPVAAGTFAAQLGAVGYSWGIGNIHPGLYSTAAIAGSSANWTDVTSGTTTTAKPAGVGYDQATGLGTPRWDVLLPTLGGDPRLSVSYYQRNPETIAVITRKAPFQTFTGYRVVPADFAFPACTVGSPTPPTTVDITQGDPGHVPGTGDYDGEWSLALVAVDQQGVCHYAFASVFVDELTPGVTSVGLSPDTATGKMTAVVHTNDEVPSSGVKSHYIEVFEFPRGSTAATRIIAVHQASPRVTFTTRPGYGYSARAKATDGAGNTSPLYGGSPKLWAPLDDRSFALSGIWSAGSGTPDLMRTWRATGRAGAAASLTGRGKRFTLLMRTGPAYGKAGIYVGTTLVRVVDLYSTSLRYQVPVTVSASTTVGTRTVVVRVLGQRNTRSRGTTVVLDGLHVTS